MDSDVKRVRELLEILGESSCTNGRELKELEDLIFAKKCQEDCYFYSSFTWPNPCNCPDMCARRPVKLKDCYIKLKENR